MLYKIMYKLAPEAGLNKRSLRDPNIKGFFG